jgi:hypothetical protein
MDIARGLGFLQTSQKGRRASGENGVLFPLKTFVQWHSAKGIWIQGDKEQKLNARPEGTLPLVTGAARMNLLDLVIPLFLLSTAYLLLFTAVR